MRVFPRSFRVLAALCAAVVLAGCEDEIPTASGADRLGEQPLTIELTLPASAFVRGDTVFTDFTGARETAYLLVANRFDGVLTANLLASLAWPDSILFLGQLDSVASYGQATVRTVVDSTATTGDEVALRLWALAESWDSASVSWEEARAGVPWQVPGGTPGELLGEQIWVRGDTAQRDTVSWLLTPTTVAALADGRIPGLLVTARAPGARAQVSPISIEVQIHPFSRPDTTALQLLTNGPQAFVFTPDVPARGPGWSVGGVTGDRAVFELDLRQLLPSCPDGRVTPDCPLVPLRDVTLNRATLLLDPIPPATGFRPVVFSTIAVRRVLEPQLGRRAPLAERLVSDTIPAAAFPDPGAAAVELDLTQAIRAFAATDSAKATVALLTEPENGSFGFMRFSDQPRLRLLYTLFLRPRLP